MKSLFFILIFLFGCTGEQTIRVDPSTLKFTAGEEVKTSILFYANCVGRIEGYAPYYDPVRTEVYEVSFYCPNLGWSDKVTIHEKDLIKMVSK